MVPLLLQAVQLSIGKAILTIHNTFLTSFKGQLTRLIMWSIPEQCKTVS